MTISNSMTISRLVLSPVFIIIFLQQGLWARIGAFIIVAVNELTDLLDGIVARRRKEVTDFGKIIDPMSDSLYHLTVFLCFVAKGYAPVWMVALLFYRDFIISYLRTLGSMHGQVLQARSIGKRKTMAQGFAIIIILFLDIIRQYHPISWFFSAAYILVGVATFVSVLAGIEYIVANRKLYRKLSM